MFHDTKIFTFCSFVGKLSVKMFFVKVQPRPYQNFVNYIVLYSIDVCSTYTAPLFLLFICLYSIDATEEPKSGPSLGRLVNHGDCREVNSKMQLIKWGDPVLCLFALKEIDAGDEILYDYGVNNLPWRKRKVGGSYNFLLHYSHTLLKVSLIPYYK